MSKLFLFSLDKVFDRISLDLMVLIINAIIIFASLIAIVLSVVKGGYGILKRLWIVLFMVGITLIQLWLELMINGYIKHLFLTVGVCVCLLSIIMFLPKKTIEITRPQRNLARFLSDSASKITQDDYQGELIKESNVFSSPVIKTQQKSEPIQKSEIEFSHVKSVLNKLEYYPLKEQDKKQAKELEDAIFSAEQDGLNMQLKEKINDGLGALLKIMSKYAI